MALESREDYSVEMTLADRSVTLFVPDRWEMTERMFSHSIFRIRGIEHADVLFVIESFENADAVAADDLAAYLEWPGGENSIAEEEIDTVREADGRIDWPRLVLRKDALRSDPETGAPNANAIVWRRICPVGEKNIRVLTVTLTLPIDGGDATGAKNDIHRTTVDLSQQLVETALFSPDLTPLDRIAATLELEPRWFEDVAAIRLPRGWPMDLEKLPNGREMACFEDLENDLWTLWVQIQIISPIVADPADYVSQCLELAVETVAERSARHESTIFLNSDDPTKGYVRISVPYEEDGKSIRHICWASLKHSAGLSVMLWVHWYVDEAAADLPHVKALTDIVEAEVPNALILNDLAATIFAEP